MVGRLPKIEKKLTRAARETLDERADGGFDGQKTCTIIVWGKPAAVRRRKDLNKHAPARSLLLPAVATEGKER